jgi:hypothetical protein
MILILLRDGSTAEITAVEDVVHGPGSLVCVDYLGAPVASFFAEGVLAYTLDPSAIHRYRSAENEPPRRRRSRWSRRPRERRDQD